MRGGSAGEGEECETPRFETWVTRWMMGPPTKRMLKEE